MMPATRQHDSHRSFPNLSRLGNALYRCGWALGALMVANSIYLVLFGLVIDDATTLPVLYQSMLLGHTLVGLLMLGLLIPFVGGHVSVVLRSDARVRLKFAGAAVVLAFLFLTISGVVLLLAANNRDNAWVFAVHQLLAMVFLAGFLLHRFWAGSRSKGAPLRHIAITAFVLLVIVGAHLAEHERGAAGVETVASKAASPDEAMSSGKGVQLLSLVAVLEADPSQVFFPGRVTTTSGGFVPAATVMGPGTYDAATVGAQVESEGFADAIRLGAEKCGRCHADVVEQWSTSAHRFSSFNNPFYAKSVALTRAARGDKATQFCAACHDPALLLLGSMLAPVDATKPEAQAGLTCLSCHLIDAVHGLAGNGNYRLQTHRDAPYLFAGDMGGWRETVHDYLVKAKPAAHRQRLKKPFFSEATYCMSCHKVSIDKPVNDYRWLRGQNEYDAWHNSGAALNQPQTWYEPAEARTCRDCHMPLEAATRGDLAARDGRVRSHRFLAANTALPALRGDQASVAKVEEFLRSEKLAVEIFAIRRASGDLLMNVGVREVHLQPGEVVQVEIVVRNLDVGHSFPGGTNDSNEGWMEFSVLDGGRRVFHSGGLNDTNHVDPAAHFYRAVFVDAGGGAVTRRNVHDIRSLVYANLIPPSGSDIVRYRFRVPPVSAGARLTLRASLQWRKFRQAFTDFVFAEDESKRFPITEISSDSIDILVVEGSSQVATEQQADNWMRYNDYGIGSLLDGDSKTALAAFAAVARLQPRRVDGWLNQARVYLQDGALALAEENLQKATEVAPADRRLNFFRGLLLERYGRLTEAEQAYRRALQDYPQGRDVWMRLAQVLRLNGQDERAIDAYVEVLRLDPESAQPYYHLAGIYRSLAARSPERREGYMSLAEKLTQAFVKYKVDDAADALTREYRAAHPHDNLMSQRKIVHELIETPRKR